MKIDPSGKTSQFQQPAIDNTRSKEGGGGFDAVLKQTLQKPAAPENSQAASAGRMAGTIAPIAAPHGPANALGIHAEKLLDRMEAYRNMLGDPAVTLKEIQPAVEQLRKQAIGARTLIADMPDGHPLSAVVRDIIDSIDQEVARFHAGYYVDD